MHPIIKKGLIKLRRNESRAQVRLVGITTGLIIALLGLITLLVAAFVLNVWYSDAIRERAVETEIVRAHQEWLQKMYVDTEVMRLQLEGKFREAVRYKEEQEYLAKRRQITGAPPPKFEGKSHGPVHYYKNYKDE